jgi:hypothetical protein
VVPQLEKTIELNRTALVGRGGSLSVAKLAWGSQPSAKQNNTPGILASKPDLILLSDCVYYEEVIIIPKGFPSLCITIFIFLQITPSIEVTLDWMIIHCLLMMA